MSSKVLNIRRHEVQANESNKHQKHTAEKMRNRALELWKDSSFEQFFPGIVHGGQCDCQTGSVFRQVNRWRRS